MNDRPHPSVFFFIMVALCLMAGSTISISTNVARIADSLERMGK